MRTGLKLLALRARVAESGLLDAQALAAAHHDPQMIELAESGLIVTRLLIERAQELETNGGDLDGDELEEAVGA